MKMLAILAASFAILALGQDSPEIRQTKAKLALDATGLIYQTTASGRSYSIVFDHENKRQRTVFMSNVPNFSNGLVTYNLYTQVWGSDKAPDAELLKKVMTKVKKVGAFYLYKDTNQMWSIRFGARLDATDMPENPKPDDNLVKSLKDFIYLINAVGEETALELKGKQE